MYFPSYRARRLRSNENFRRLIRETKLSVDDLIYPLFVVEGENVQHEISSMPGNYHFSVDRIAREAKAIEDLRIPAIVLFGIPDKKDEEASQAYADDGVTQRAIRAIKEAAPNLLVITDVCLCEYMSHGHCGIVKGEKILNDPTLDLLAQTALSHAKAGADMVAPSDMMDGRVAAIRDILDDSGFEDIPIMSYAAKYASYFYGPFREAAESAPKFGNRRSYQMDPPNIWEALREVVLDIEEGADIVMVKPAMAYLDVVSRVKEEFGYPLAAYNVSGEFAMVKAAGRNNWIDEKHITLEILSCIKRAGADMILTYHAKEVAEWISQ